MKSAPPPSDEKERLEYLKEIQILDTATEDLYDNITELAAKICGVPICLISLIDENRQWFKSHYGLNATETPRDFAFCAHAIHNDETFLIKDSRKDKRFSDNPLVTGDPNVIFYAGKPIKNFNGVNLGTLCIIDNNPGDLSDEQNELLGVLAKQIAVNFEMRKLIMEKEEQRLKIQSSLRAKINFFNYMSHEIRTPMNAILGMTNILKETKLSEEQIDLVDTISIAGDSLTFLIDDILNLAKFSSDEFKVKNSHFSPDKELEKIKKILKEKADEKGLKLKIQNNLVPNFYVFSDKNRFKQLVINFIYNAIKYSEKGSITIILSFQNETNELKVEVQDEGIGVSQKKIKEIFKAFSQIENDEKETEGVGLGLKICQKILNSLKGSIDVQSEEGIGSTFSFKYKVEIGDQPNEDVQEKKNDVNLVGVKILVAEDNLLNQKLIFKYLSKFGADVFLVSDGQQAREVIEKGEVEIAFLDLLMPKLGGLELANEISKMKKIKKNVSLVACTANAFPDQEEECLNVGFDYFLPKPIKKDELVRILNLSIKKIRS